MQLNVDSFQNSLRSNALIQHAREGESKSDIQDSKTPNDTQLCKGSSSFLSNDEKSERYISTECHSITSIKSEKVSEIVPGLEHLQDYKSWSVEDAFFSPSLLNVLSENSSPIDGDDLASPLPLCTFSPTDKIQANKKLKLRKVIEELVDTESSFVSSLSMLLNYYLEPLMLGTATQVPLQLQFMQTILCELLKFHIEFLYKLKCVTRCSLRFDSSALQVAKIVADSGIDLFLHEEYCNLYEDVLQMVKDNDIFESSILKMNRKWIKAWGNYLEATQPLEKRMDLSFISLVQKPIARISKYRLILESMGKYLEKDSLETLESSIKKIKYKLLRINSRSKSDKYHELNSKVDDLISFATMNHHYKLCSNFFGQPLLIGALQVLWVENSHLRSSMFGSVLFKSHLILSDVLNRKSKKSLVKFILPLSSCKYYTENQITKEGIYSEYPYLIKIEFENSYCHYELLLAVLSLKEYEQWRIKFDVLINFVNGPPKFDYSHDTNHLISFPELMSPSDLKHDENVYISLHDICYFKALIPVSIGVNFRVWVDEGFDAKLLSFYCNYKNTESKSSNKPMVMMKRSDRLTIETYFMEIWSTQLPFVVLPKNAALKKSSSWSSFRMGSLKAIRHTNSLTGSSKSSINFEPFSTSSGGKLRSSKTDPEISRHAKFGNRTTLSSSPVILSKSYVTQSPMSNNEKLETAVDSNLKAPNAGSSLQSSRSLKLKNLVLGIFQPTITNAYTNQ